jgi:hypothetical protein
MINLVVYKLNITKIRTTILFKGRTDIQSIFLSNACYKVYGQQFHQQSEQKPLTVTH